MMPGPEHLIIAPVLIPFFAGTLVLVYDERQRAAKLTISLVSVIAMLFVAIELLVRLSGSALTGDNDIGFYLLGDWAAPWGIVLVVDRLSAMMLVLTAALALPALVYSAAAWHRQGQHFHSMLQFMLMGLNGAFLTGDLFNLFVFFELLLAASYGLLLHGGGQLRVRAGLHYIAVNLTGSLLFLIGVSLIYGATGSLNMAHLSNMVPALPEAQRALFHAGAAIMGIAFLVKAGIWPLSFWLPTAYMASAAPVAGMFAIMTKVGVYVILRLSFLMFGAEAGASAGPSWSRPAWRPSSSASSVSSPRRGWAGWRRISCWYRPGRRWPRLASRCPETGPGSWRRRFSISSVRRWRRVRCSC
jgi:multicomponent K+:H+ antiporter subunit D